MFSRNGFYSSKIELDNCLETNIRQILSILLIQDTSVISLYRNMYSNDITGLLDGNGYRIT